MECKISQLATTQPKSTLRTTRLFDTRQNSIKIQFQTINIKVNLMKSLWRVCLCLLLFHWPFSLNRRRCRTCNERNHLKTVRKVQRLIMYDSIFHHLGLPTDVSNFLNNERTKKSFHFLCHGINQHRREITSLTINWCKFVFAWSLLQDWTFRLKVDEKQNNSVF